MAVTTRPLVDIVVRDPPWGRLVAPPAVPALVDTRGPYVVTIAPARSSTLTSAAGRVYSVEYNSPKTGGE